MPDFAIRPYLSGKLGHLKSTGLNLKYIGVLSRFEIRDEPIKYDILILLSGPEPQRSFLEQKMLTAFKNDNRKVVMVCGVVENEVKIINWQYISL